MTSEKIQFHKYVQNYIERLFKENKKSYIKKYNKYLILYLQEIVYKDSVEVLITLMNAMKAENILEGNNKEERYDYFDNYSSNDIFFELLDSFFPTLIPRLNRKLLGIIKNYEIFVSNFYRDFDLICVEFNWLEENIENCEIEFGVSDYHNNFKEVYIISHGHKKIVYKPRSGSNELYWNAIINWVNSKSNIKLPKLNVCNRETYQWQEFIFEKSCTSNEEIKKLYYRVGMLACLIYTLNATDIHMENMITSGSSPYIVDLETILQVKYNCIKKNAVDTATDILKNSVYNSALSTHFLPIADTYGKTHIDFSGISGTGNQIIKNGGTKVLNPFTDEMSLVKTDLKIESKKNIGKLLDKHIEPRDYTREITLGFSCVYRLILNNHLEFLNLATENEYLKNVKIRHIFRDTEFYGNILNIIKKPKYLSSKDKLLDFLELVKEVEIGQNCKIIYDKEISSLYYGDIPHFYMTPFSGTVYDSDGLTCYEFDEYPINAVRKKAFNMNEEDLEFQLKLINYSLLHFEKPWRSRGDVSIDNVKKVNINDREFLLEEAIKIGDIILDKALICKKTKTINWLDISNVFPCWQIGPQDVGIYSGLSGNALLFLMLHKATKKMKYKNILQKILNTIDLDLLKNSSNPGSAFNGKISVAYLYMLLYRYNFGREYLLKAEDLIRSSMDEILKSDEVDVIEGSSGIMLIIINLFKVTKNNLWRNFAIEIGEKIDSAIEMKENVVLYKKNDNNEILMDGFAHGLSGISYSLGELYKITKDIKWLDLVTKLNNLNSNNYDVELGNWIDLRDEEDRYKNDNPVLWCHGASGIGLSKIRLLDIVNTKEDVERAYKTVINKGLNINGDSLCHGNFGNIDFIIEYDKKFNNNEDNRLLCVVKDLIKDRNLKYKNGIVQEFETVNFMLGLSGIAYELLRLYDNGIPSILLLEI